MKEIPERVKYKERLTNQFLLQLLFGILAMVGVYLIYRGYNSTKVILAMPIIIKSLCGLSAALVALLLFLWVSSVKKGKNIPTMRNAALYALGCSVGLMWIIIYPNKMSGIRVLFAAVGAFFVIAFIVYFIRFYWGNKFKKKKR